MARRIPLSEERILRTKSRGCCTICKKDLVGGGPGAESNLSEMAHIRGVAPGSKRHDPSMDADTMNKHTNLILLCRDCHKIVDGKDSEYTVDMLEEAKSKFEAYAKRRLVKDLRDTSFAELEVVAKWVVSAPAPKPERDYAVTAPLKKIRKNGLSRTAQAWIEMGMSKSHLVGKYVEAQPDTAFGERLKEGFRVIYRRLREEEGLDGEDTFFRMLDMGAGLPGVEDQTPAVLIVLVYLFEKCEVFER